MVERNVAPSESVDRGGSHLWWLVFHELPFKSNWRMPKPAGELM